LLSILFPQASFSNSPYFQNLRCFVGTFARAALGRLAEAIELGAMEHPAAGKPASQEDGGRAGLVELLEAILHGADRAAMVAGCIGNTNQITENPIDGFAVHFAILSGDFPSRSRPYARRVEISLFGAGNARDPSGLSVASRCTRSAEMAWCAP